MSRKQAVGHLKITERLVMRKKQEAVDIAHDIVHSGRECFTIRLSEWKLQEINKKINFAITGYKECNIYDKKTKKLVPRFSPEVDKRLAEAQSNARRGKSFAVMYDITAEGEIVNLKLVEVK